MTALRVGGISQKKLLRPFLFVACLVMMLFYVNFEYVQPRALAMIEHFEKQYFSEHARVYTRKVHALTLQDHSLLLYQNYDEKEHLFKDVYWIKNEEEIFRIKQLSFASSPFVGFYVDHLKRLSTGEIRRVETHERLSFPQIILSAPLLRATLRPPSMQSLSQLFHTMRTKQLFFTQKKVSDHDAESRALFYFKLFLPITALLAVIGPAPFCLRICRTLPLFWIYAFSLAGMVTLYTLLHSLYILSESQVLPAWIFLSLPFLFLCAILRLRNPST
jgi:lipopolysaccharide export system permease protein